MKKLFLMLLGFAIGLLVAYFYCCKSNNTEDMTPPKGLITPKEAQALDIAFDLRHRLISDSIVRRSDNRSAWWSIEDIEAYLAYAKNQANELGYDMNGIRVYLGAYPTLKNNVGYTTMFMVPTGNPSVSEGGRGAIVGNNDIPGGDGLNDGTDGDPVGANYPQ